MRCSTVILAIVASLRDGPSSPRGRLLSRHDEYSSTGQFLNACNRRVTVMKTAPAAPSPTYLPQHVVRVRVWKLHVLPV